MDNIKANSKLKIKDIILRVILVMTIISIVFFFISISVEVSSGDYGTPGTRIGAICNDGWRSSSTGSGTCSSHGGVDYWLYRGGTESTYQSHRLIQDTWIYHIIANTFILMLFYMWHRIDSKNDINQKKLIFATYFSDVQKNIIKYKDILSNYENSNNSLNFDGNEKELLKITLSLMQVQKDRVGNKYLIKSYKHELFQNDYSYVLIFYFISVGFLFFAQSFAVGLTIIFFSSLTMNYLYSHCSFLIYTIKSKRKLKHVKKLI